ncbi:LppP/LprE family lipoprotein [Corynebacterium sp. UMB4614]|uniref:LppP/LprE family lipoprotein n=1 Tax=Corynebacterium sp. UMB4614 TaxID=3046334 RepID=UPI00254ED551|nr:LppP/LprE family lipoprotein [Corynebacterium sp. UMB4614]MDK7135789.1 LppP/LprE family lipoprotein [Corynebacterium sp. UMB4614]
MRLHNVALPLALSCVLVGGLTACSSDGSDAADSSSPVTITQTVKKTRPAESKDRAKPKPTRKAQESEPSKKTRPKRCGDLSAEEALAQNVGKVQKPPFFADKEWSTEFAGTGLYDPCADLSPIDITFEGATGSTPHHIMLFHRGEYLGTATAEPQGFTPAMKRVDDQTIAVTYFYTKPGEANAMRSGEAHATFTWDPGQEKVVMDGNLPPRG